MFLLVTFFFDKLELKIVWSFEVKKKRFKYKSGKNRYRSRVFFRKLIIFLTRSPRNPHVILVEMPCYEIRQAKIHKLTLGLVG